MKFVVFLVLYTNLCCLVATMYKVILHIEGRSGIAVNDSDS